MKKPALHGIFETALYVTDLARSVDFNKRIFQFELLFSNERMKALQVSKQQVLLLFLKGTSSLLTIIPSGKFRLMMEPENFILPF